MGTFHYCSSLDELEWYVGDVGYGLFIKAMTLDKTKLRKLIEESCSGDVYGWNGVEAPVRGETIEGAFRRTVPQGNITLYFSDLKDYTFLKLKMP